jgi:hypothetical protein
MGTIAYGVYGNPKSGNHGSIFTDGTITGWDLDPGGSPWEDATSDERSSESPRLTAAR